MGIRLYSDNKFITYIHESSKVTDVIDCVVNGQVVQAAQWKQENLIESGCIHYVVFDHLPPGEKKISLYLSHRLDMHVQQLEVDNQADVEPVPQTSKRWLTYGSSITQSSHADSPAQTWPALVAEEHDLHLTNLGFGGECHLEPEVARMIRACTADYISICAGINIHGACSLSPRTFQSSLLGFIRIIREQHVDTPLVVISPIFSALKHHGDENISYVDGLQLFAAVWSERRPTYAR